MFVCNLAMQASWLQQKYDNYAHENSSLLKAPDNYTIGLCT